MPRSNSTSFFRNTACAYFPCHKGLPEEDFNCLMCYCPLYLLGDQCGGNFTYLENGIKSCVNCTRPHDPEKWEEMMNMVKKVCRKVQEQRDSAPH